MAKEAERGGAGIEAGGERPTLRDLISTGVENVLFGTEAGEEQPRLRDLVCSREGCAQNGKVIPDQMAVMQKGKAFERVAGRLFPIGCRCCKSPMQQSYEAPEHRTGAVKSGSEEIRVQVERITIIVL